MSSVFLADVDDYLSPSTACVNPAFANNTNGGNGDTTTTTTTTTTVTAAAANQPQNHQPKHNGGDIASEGIVRSRRPRNPVVRRGRGIGLSSSTRKPFDTGNSNKVTASIVDCLACSGCVTTAETVLLKEHSVDKFRELVRARTRTRRNSTAPTVTVGDMTDDNSMDNIDRMEVDEEDEINDSAQVVITLSIASAAELLRLLRHKRNNIDNSSGSTVHTADLQLLHRKLVALLCRQLSVDAVLDGQLALEWSLQQSALEFCDRYQQQQQQPQTVSHDGQQQLHGSDTTDKISTLVSSSCPATVCYVEKTCHNAVPHLSRVMSPMGCARSYLSSMPKQTVHHVAIMPCHDKKLEATRPATNISSSNSDGATNNQNVLVLTTSDCWQLLLESIDLAGDEEDDDDRAELLLLPSREEKLRQLFESLPPSVVDRVKFSEDFEPRRQAIVPNSWITSGAVADDDGDNTLGSASASSLSLLYTSGGYADCIFRFAARRMFGSSIFHVEWKAVSVNALQMSSAATADDSAMSSSSSSSMRSRPVNGAHGRPTTASARVAAARRDILEATLYRHEFRRRASSSLPPDESVVVEYSQHEHPTIAASEGRNGSASSLVLVSTTPVLRFAMAHGLQVMQRAISNAGSSNEGGAGSSRYHYVEAMACPSGCLNGGGQLLPSQDGRREPPSEVKARVGSANRNLRVPPPPFQQLQDTILLQPHSMSYHRNTLNEHLQTSFHAVQPLQLQYGAAKGMAAKDIQW